MSEQTTAGRHHLSSGVAAEADVVRRAQGLFDSGAPAPASNGPVPLPASSFQLGLGNPALVFVCCAPGFLPGCASSVCLDAETGEVILREIDGFVLQQRRSDGYWNATAMCQASGKQMAHYTANAGTQGFLTELSSAIGIPIPDLVVSNMGGMPGVKGTWVHPKVAYHLAQWCSPRFAVKVSYWIDELFTTGKVELAPTPRTREVRVHGHDPSARLLTGFRFNASLDAETEIEVLIPIDTSGTEPRVDARQLHQYLGSKQQFADWMDNRCEAADLVKNKDFGVFHNPMKNPKGGRPATEYWLTVDAAAEFCMLEQTDKGKETRRYFIECAKKLKALTETPAIDFSDPVAVCKLYLEAEESRRRALGENQQLRLENTAVAAKVGELADHVTNVTNADARAATREQPTADCARSPYPAPG